MDFNGTIYADQFKNTKQPITESRYTSPSTFLCILVVQTPLINKYTIHYLMLLFFFGGWGVESKVLEKREDTFDIKQTVNLSTAWQMTKTTSNLSSATK